MRKAIVKPFLASAAAVALLAGASVMLLQSRHAAAEAGGRERELRGGRPCRGLTRTSHITDTSTENFSVALGAT